MITFQGGREGGKRWGCFKRRALNDNEGVSLMTSLAMTSEIALHDDGGLSPIYPSEFRFCSYELNSEAMGCYNGQRYAKRFSQWYGLELGRWLKTKKQEYRPSKS